MTAAAAHPARPRETENKSTTINLRIPQTTRDLIDHAAAALGKSRTEFMLDSARQQAVDVLLDQRLFRLSAEQFDAFLHALDNPSPPNQKLKMLFERPSPWEQKK